MLKIFLTKIGRLHLKRIETLERKIGYRLIFPKITRTWINGFVKLNLTRRWRKFGLNVTGVDYFTMGAIHSHTSTRFDPHARQYQSWLGAYLAQFASAKDRTLQNYLNLAVIDQLDWLKHYGDRKPLCLLRAATFRRTGFVDIGGYRGHIYEGGGLSHSDIGIHGHGPWLWIVTLFLATVFNVVNNELRVRQRNFLPLPVRASYGPVYLKGYVIVVELTKTISVVLYGNGVIFRSESGGERNTYEELRSEMLQLLTAVKIQRL